MNRVRQLGALLLLAWLAAPGEARAQVPPVVLDTIPVTGSRVSADLPLRTRAVQVLDREALLALPARNVADALRWGLGIDLSARSGAQADLSIRGASFEQVLVLVDGRRMSDPQTGHFDLDLTVPLERVERIEILRGPASAVYGADAIGGVVNIITRDDASWTGRVEAGSFGTGSASIHGGFGARDRFSGDVTAEVGRSDGHRDGTDWEQTLGSAGVGIPLFGGRVTGDAGWARRDFGAADFYAPRPSFEATRTTTASAGWRSRSPGVVSVEPIVAWRRHTDDFILERDDPDFYRNVHTSTQLGGEVVGRIHPGEGVVLAVGGELYRDRLESTALGDREEDRWAVFAEAAVPLPDDVDLSIGLRRDGHDLWGEATSPSVGAVWQASPRFGAFFSWGRSFRGPSWTERHYEDPSHRAREDLLPETARSAELGFVWEDPGEFRLDVAAFRRHTRNLIDWARPAGSDGLWETRNVARARFRGLEVAARWPLDPGTSVSVGGAWLSIEAGIDEELDSRYALRPIRDQVHVGVTRRLPDDAILTLRGVQGRRAGDETYREVDVRLQVPLLSGVLYVDVRNATDTRHADITGNPVPGRAYYAGFRLGGG